jgi:hypothetical protein
MWGCGWAGLKLKALLLLTTAAPFLLYTSSLAPGFLHSLPRLLKMEAGAVKKSKSDIVFSTLAVSLYTE